MKSTNKNGYVIFENSWIVAIATGFARKSANVKTGDMIQIWILNRNLHPVIAQRTGKDKLVCGDCPLRPVNAAAGESKCYVQTDRAPAAVWRTYQRGGYARMESTDVFVGRNVRFGAYGDPAKLPLPLVADIAGKARRWTGYTHQWRNPLYAGFSRFLMASADDVESQIDARGRGWRTFRVAPTGSDFRLSDEISCPASKESGARTTCAQCTLCRGASITAKSIVIQAH